MVKLNFLKFKFRHEQDDDGQRGGNSGEPSPRAAIPIRRHGDEDEDVDDGGDHRPSASSIPDEVIDSAAARICADAVLSASMRSLSMSSPQHGRGGGGDEEGNVPAATTTGRGRSSPSPQRGHQQRGDAAADAGNCTHRPSALEGDGSGGGLHEIKHNRAAPPRLTTANALLPQFADTSCIIVDSNLAGYWRQKKERELSLDPTPHEKVVEGFENGFERIAVIGRYIARKIRRIHKKLKILINIDKYAGEGARDKVIEYKKNQKIEKYSRKLKALLCDLDAVLFDPIATNVFGFLNYVVFLFLLIFFPVVSFCYYAFCQLYFIITGSEVRPALLRRKLAIGRTLNDNYEQQLKRATISDGVDVSKRRSGSVAHHRAFHFVPVAYGEFISHTHSSYCKVKSIWTQKPTPYATLRALHLEKEAFKGRRDYLRTFYWSYCRQKTLLKQRIKDEAYDEQLNRRERRRRVARGEICEHFVDEPKGFFERRRLRKEAEVRQELESRLRQYSLSHSTESPPIIKKPSFFRRYFATPYCNICFEMKLFFAKVAHKIDIDECCTATYPRMAAAECPQISHNRLVERIEQEYKQHLKAVALKKKLDEKRRQDEEDRLEAEARRRRRSSRGGGGPEDALNATAANITMSATANIGGGGSRSSNRSRSPSEGALDATTTVSYHRHGRSRHRSPADDEDKKKKQHTIWGFGMPHLPAIFSINSSSKGGRNDRSRSRSPLPPKPFLPIPRTPGKGPSTVAMRAVVTLMGRSVGEQIRNQTDHSGETTTFFSINHKNNNNNSKDGGKNMNNNNTNNTFGIAGRIGGLCPSIPSSLVIVHEDPTLDLDRLMREDIPIAVTLSDQYQNALQAQRLMEIADAAIITQSLALEAVDIAMSAEDDPAKNFRVAERDRKFESKLEAKVLKKWEQQRRHLDKYAAEEQKKSIKAEARHAKMASKAEKKWREAMLKEQHEAMLKQREIELGGKENLKRQLKIEAAIEKEEKKRAKKAEKEAKSARKALEKLREAERKRNKANGGGNGSRSGGGGDYTVEDGGFFNRRSLSDSSRSSDSDGYSLDSDDDDDDNLYSDGNLGGGGGGGGRRNFNYFGDNGDPSCLYDGGGLPTATADIADPNAPYRLTTAAKAVVTLPASVAWKGVRWMIPKSLKSKHKERIRLEREAKEDEERRKAQAEEEKEARLPPVGCRGISLLQPQTASSQKQQQPPRNNTARSNESIPSIHIHVDGGNGAGGGGNNNNNNNNNDAARDDDNANAGMVRKSYDRVARMCRSAGTYLSNMAFGPPQQQDANGRTSSSASSTPRASATSAIELTSPLSLRHRAVARRPPFLFLSSSPSPSPSVTPRAANAGGGGGGVVDSNSTTNLFGGGPTSPTTTSLTGADTTVSGVSGGGGATTFSQLLLSTRGTAYDDPLFISFFADEKVPHFGLFGLRFFNRSVEREEKRAKARRRQRREEKHRAKAISNSLLLADDDGGVGCGTFGVSSINNTTTNSVMKLFAATMNDGAGKSPDGNSNKKGGSGGGDDNDEGGMLLRRPFVSVKRFLERRKAQRDLAVMIKAYSASPRAVERLLADEPPIAVAKCVFRTQGHGHVSTAQHHDHHRDADADDNKTNIANKKRHLPPPSSTSVSVEGGGGESLATTAPAEVSRESTPDRPPPLRNTTTKPTSPQAPQAEGGGGGGPTDTNATNTAAAAMPHRTVSFASPPSLSTTPSVSHNKNNSSSARTADNNDKKTTDHHHHSEATASAAYDSYYSSAKASFHPLQYVMAKKERGEKVWVGMKMLKEDYYEKNFIHEHELLMKRRRMAMAAAAAAAGVSSYDDYDDGDGHDHNNNGGGARTTTMAMPYASTVPPALRDGRTRYCSGDDENPLQSGGGRRSNNNNNNSATAGPPQFLAIATSDEDSNSNGYGRGRGRGGDGGSSSGGDGGSSSAGDPSFALVSPTIMMEKSMYQRQKKRNSELLAAANRQNSLNITTTNDPSAPPPQPPTPSFENALRMFDEKCHREDDAADRWKSATTNRGPTTTTVHAIGNGARDGDDASSRDSTQLPLQRNQTTPFDGDDKFASNPASNRPSARYNPLSIPNPAAATTASSSSSANDLFLPLVAPTTAAPSPSSADALLSFPSYFDQPATPANKQPAAATTTMMMTSVPRSSNSGGGPHHRFGIPSASALVNSSSSRAGGLPPSQSPPHAHSITVEGRDAALCAGGGGGGGGGGESTTTTNYHYQEHDHRGEDTSRGGDGGEGAGPLGGRTRFPAVISSDTLRTPASWSLTPTSRSSERSSETSPSTTASNQNQKNQPAAAAPNTQKYQPPLKLSQRASFRQRERSEATAEKKNMNSNDKKRERDGINNDSCKKNDSGGNDKNTSLNNRKSTRSPLLAQRRPSNINTKLEGGGAMTQQAPHTAN